MFDEGIQLPNKNIFSFFSLMNGDYYSQTKQTYRNIIND